MLQLEKISKTREVNISLRNKTPLLNSTFLQALAIAIAFHLVGAFVFQIKPFFVSKVDMIFPPVIVNTDLSIFDRTAVAQVKKDERGKNFPLEPQYSQIEFPEMPLTTHTPRFEIPLEYDPIHLESHD